jgi:uncharacterized protein
LEQAPPNETSARDPWRWLARVTLGLYLLLAVVGLYGFWVEPYWIEITRHEISAPVSRKIRIAQVSDLHTRGLSGRERKLLALLEAEAPDAVILTGDYITTRSDWTRVKDVLSQFKAPLGVWVVRGNWEDTNTLQRSLPALEDEGGFYQEAGVKLLVNQAARLVDDVWILGLDDELKGEPDVPGTISQVPAGAFRLAVFHSPTLFDELAGKVDLALAGHTHGGQIRVPGIGALYLPPGSGRFLEGWYQTGESRLYVSRGVGTTLVDMRLFCRPELPIFDLIPK